jgi:hypothetical protein
MRYNITALFFCIDEFCKAFEEWEKHRLCRYDFGSDLCESSGTNPKI